MSEADTALPTGLSKSATQWAMATHLIALVGFLGLPLGNVLGPLILWLLKKDDHPFVDENGKESLNFQISMVIYGVVAAILCLILIGFVLAFLLLVVDLVCLIKAALAADKGKTYRYPLTIRFLK